MEIGSVEMLKAAARTLCTTQAPMRRERRLISMEGTLMIELLGSELEVAIRDFCGYHCSIQLRESRKLGVRTKALERFSVFATFAVCFTALARPRLHDVKSEVTIARR